MLEQLKRVPVKTFVAVVHKLPARVKRERSNGGTVWIDYNRAVAQTRFNQCFVAPVFAQKVCKINIDKGPN